MHDLLTVTTTQVWDEDTGTEDATPMEEGS